MADEKDRQESEQADELAEQQDLNQGMSTGTHDSSRHGVKWPPSYRRKIPAADKPTAAKETTTRADDTD